MSNVEYMQHAIRLAGKGRYSAAPNPCVGCVIVNNGEIVGEGWHQRAGEAHAEVRALEQAGEKAKGAVVFVSLEPCSHTGKTPPCADALISAGVSKVIVAMQDPNPQVAGSGLHRLQQAGIEIECGLLEEQARALNPGFIKRMEAGRPYVRIKLAMSLDGRTAMASGESKWISCEASRNDVQRLRAESSAVLTGIATVLADDPEMNVRLSAQQLDVEQIRQPKRIVLDSHLRIPLDAKIINGGQGQGDECLVYTAANVNNKNSYPFVLERCTMQAGKVSLNALMQDLAKKEINLIHVEAGSVLCGALLQDELVDEIVLYMAPHIMGDNAKGLFHLPGLEKMKHRVALHVKDVRSIGSDIRMILQPAYSV